MECNKEEALSAVKLAETKVQNKDFIGARKMAEKAQRLYSNLENILQLHAVCEVHCTAENKLGGSEMDWYGILQVQQFDNEITIKKQYRKLALLLHPDKNKFAGSEAAFKLIGEANRVLADKKKRLLYDIKYRALARSGIPKTTAHQSNVDLFVRKYTDTATSSHNVPQSQGQPNTFWTQCSFCHSKYQYYRDFLDRLLCCQRCRRAFEAHEFKEHVLPPESLWNQFPKHKEPSNQGPSNRASQSNGGTDDQNFTRFQKEDAVFNPVSKVERQPNTFWTQCSFCHSKYQYYRDFLDRLLCCQRCQRAFEAHEFKEHVLPPESHRNQFPKHKEPSNQGPSNRASQSNGGTDDQNFTRFQKEDAAFNPVSKVETSAELSGESKSQKKDVFHGDKLGVSRSGPERSKDTGTSTNLNKSDGNLKRGNRARADSEDSIKPSETNGGHHPRRSPRNKQRLSSTLSNDDDDFVNPPPKRLRKGQLFGVAEKENNATVGGLKKEARQNVSSSLEESLPNKKSKTGAFESKVKMATVVDNVGKERNNAAVRGHEKETRQKVNFPLEESLPNKMSKTGKFEPKVKAAAKPDHGASNFKDTASPVDNVDVAFTTETIDNIPDPQYYRFDDDRLGSLMRANQTWALYDPADGMPRFYAVIKKILAPGFKLKIRWLEANPDDQDEIDWCEKDLPVACGKFKLGTTDEVTHPTFSHQVHCTKGSGKSSFLVYPRMGETWAIYQNWDIGWSSEPEKHIPYKFDFVEVLSDFVENKGIGVRYLGKVNGFVSLFQQAEQQEVVMFQVLPHELYRFSHRIPSVKMTGHEGYGVPSGSFEFDPASLPTSIFDARDVGDLEMDNRNNMELNGSVSIKRETNNLSERENSFKSPRNLDSESVNCTNGKGKSLLNDTRKKHQENDLDGVNFNHRRSPRDLGRKNTVSNVAMKSPDTTPDVSLPQSERNSTSRHCNDGMHSSVKDQHSLNLREKPVSPPRSSSPACRSSQTEFYDFKGLKSQESFKVWQVWALYSDVNGTPTTYGQVQRIETGPNFGVHLVLLEPCSARINMSGPVSCGTFKVKKDSAAVVPLASFSHCAVSETVAGLKVFEIRPSKGEVWALYKNRNPELTCSELAKAECDIVEVLEANSKSTMVQVLADVKGFKSIFKAPIIQRSKSGMIDIPHAELHRFSHQIPAFHHNGKSDSRLAGCWELDPLSVPPLISPE